MEKERRELNHRIRCILIALTIITYIVAGAANVAGIAFPLLLLGISGIIGILDILSHGPATSYEKTIYNIFILMLICIVLAYIVNFIETFTSLNRLLLIVCGMGFSVLCGNTLKSIAEIEKMSWTVIFSTVVSALVVIGQGLNVPVAYEVSAAFGAGSDLGTLATSLQSERYYGLAKSALYFAYQASAAIALLTFMPMKKKKTTKSALRFLSLGVLIVALLFNRTRSAQLSVALIFFAKIVLSVHIKMPRRTFLKLAILGSMVLVGVFFVLDKIGVEDIMSILRLNQLNHTGVTARIPMFLTAMNTGLHHPFGLGVYRANADYIVGLTTSKQIRYVLNNACHNLLANCVGNYGLITGVLMIILYGRTFRECDNLRKTNWDNHRDMIVGIELLIAVLLINAAMHNLYILNGEVLTWFGIGIIIAFCRLALQGVRGKR